MTTTHSTISPSAANRWVRCAGSVRESLKYPDTSGAAAVDGTHTHTVVESCILDNLMDPTLKVGYSLIDHEGQFTVEKPRAERAKVCIDYIKSRVQHFSGLCEVRSETRLDSTPTFGRADMSGTVDVQILTPHLWEIIDYKDGMNPVPVEGNEQLEIYMLNALGALDLKFARPETVRMTIVQPKLALKGLPMIASVEMPAVELLTKVAFYRDRAAATDDPAAPLTPGDVQCKYCKAKGNCSALANQSLEKAGITFANLEVAQQSADKNPTEMSDQQVREIMEAAPLLRQMLESVEAEAEKRLKSGHGIAGLKLVNGRGSRKWNIDDDAIADKLKRMGVPKDAIFKSSVVSPAQVEKITWQKRDGTKVQLTERQLKTIDKEYVAHMGGKLTVALEADSRAAVTTDASSLFKNIAVCNDAPQPVESLPSWLS